VPRDCGRTSTPSSLASRSVPTPSIRLQNLKDTLTFYFSVQKCTDAIHKETKPTTATLNTHPWEQNSNRDIRLKVRAVTI
jgi:hypothetical protein